MRFKPDRELLTRSIYAFFTAAALILLLILLLNLSAVARLTGALFLALTPVIIGFVTAYVIDIPTSALASLLSRTGLSPERCRSVSAVLCVLLFLGAAAAFMVYIVPELINSVLAVGDILPPLISSAERWISDLLAPFGIQMPSAGSFDIEGILNAVFPQLIDASFSLTLSVSNLLLGSIIGIYMLFGKETLLAQTQELTTAIFPESVALYLGKLANIFNIVFRSFFAGKLLEAGIIASMCFAGLTLLSMPYPALIGILIGVLNIIPFFGAFIGGALSALLVYIASPGQTVYFLIFIVAVIQLDAQLIAPRVLGDSIGLRPIWVIIAITVGASLFGFGGLMLSVPVFAVIYAFVRELVRLRLEKKAMS